MRLLKPAVMDEANSVHSSIIDIGNGKEVPKARVLRELERTTFSKVPGSTDRLNRCAGLSCYSKTNLPDLTCGLVDSTSSGLLSIGDPATTVVKCEGKFFLACYDQTACTIVIGSAEARDSFVSRWTNPRSDVVGFSQP